MEDNHCDGLEHQFQYDLENMGWHCQACSEQITEEAMNRIVERPVRIDTGHTMYIWPAQVREDQRRHATNTR